MMLATIYHKGEQGCDRERGRIGGEEGRGEEEGGRMREADTPGSSLPNLLICYLTPVGMEANLKGTPRLF